MIRSLSRLLGSDVRLAFVAGDEQTIARVEARQAVTTSWVSRLLQEIVAEMLGGADAGCARVGRDRHAARCAAGGARAARRPGARPLRPARAGSRCARRAFAVRRLLDAGYAVLAGERFRLRTPPAVRVTTAQLLPAEVEPLADALAEAATGRSLIS